MTAQERRAMMGSLFAERFGGEPEIWARAPGRVDLMGSHTDYNLGFVLTLPISRDTWIAARANGLGEVRLWAANVGEEGGFRLGTAGATGWARYLEGVAVVAAGEGLMVRGFDGVIHSTVPLESGLSSSAALECSTAVVLGALGGWRLTGKEMARLCQRAENEHVGVNCGILDQFSSCLGERECALLLDCRDLSTRVAPMAAGLGVVVCNTMNRRRLTGGEYDERRAECERGARALGVGSLREVTAETLAARGGELDERVRRRCEFIVAESGRAEALAGALAAGDRAAVGRLMSESFVGARDLYEICSPAMEAMREAMMAGPGLIGARQAGAGFGGCMVAVVERAESGAFEAAVGESYYRATGVGAEIYAVEAAAGACLMKGDEV